MVFKPKFKPKIKPVEELKKINAKLKAGKVGVQVQSRGDRLYLVATLPPKPEASKPYPHQQRIRLGYRCNPAGLKRADRDARVLSAKLIEGSFDWADYGFVAPSETVGYWIERFKTEYFDGRLNKGIDLDKINQTWRLEYMSAFKLLTLEDNLDPNALAKIIKDLGHTRTRRKLALAFGRLCDCAGLEHDLRSLVGAYSPKRVEPRKIPDDTLIATIYNQIVNPSWRYVYALMATYGLRNHEVFLADLSDYPVLFVGRGKSNIERYVYPLYPEWSEWCKDFVLPNCNGNNRTLGERVTRQFSRYKIPFSPYNLRHAWARRSMQFGWDLTLAAKQMGHSVKVHSDVYHAWLSQDVYEKAYQDILNNPDRPKPPL